MSEHDNGFILFINTFFKSTRTIFKSAKIIAEKASVFFSGPPVSNCQSLSARTAQASVLVYQHVQKNCQSLSEFCSAVKTDQQLSKFISLYSTKRQSLSDFFSNVSTISVLV